MGLNKNLVVLGLGGAAIAGVLLVKNKKIACKDESKCKSVSSEISKENFDILSISESEYDQILSKDVMDTFRSVGDACEVSMDSAIDKINLNKDIIDRFVSSVDDLIERVSQNIDSNDKLDQIRIEVLDKIYARIKSSIGSSLKKDEFLEIFFQDLKDKSLSADKEVL